MIDPLAIARGSVPVILAARSSLVRPARARANERQIGRRRVRYLLLCGSLRLPTIDGRWLRGLRFSKDGPAAIRLFAKHRRASPCAREG